MTVGGSSGTAPWPAPNDVETRLRRAADAGDMVAAMRVLAVAPLFLPGFRDAVPAAGPGAQRLAMLEREGVPYLLAFTSPQAMEEMVDSDGWRTTTLPELVREWPAGWGLAVNPASPSGVLVPPAEVPGLVRTPAHVAGFVPANPVEELLRDAIGNAEYGAALDALIMSQVVVPVRPVQVDGEVVVPVFTSPGLADRFLAGVDVPTVTLDIVEVLRRWPGPGCRLAVNPGTPVELWFAGESAADLLNYAYALADRELGDRPPPPERTSPNVPAPRSRGAVIDLLRGV